MGISDILNTGRSSLIAQQRALQVNGNNIANVNTPGFRSARVDFEQSLADAMQARGGGVARFSTRAANTPRNLNDNDVALEEETTILNQSNLHYEALAGAMTMKFSALRSALGR